MRLEAIDRVKALAIIAVPLIHAGPERWSPEITPIDPWIRHWTTGFAVPAFVMMSGLLYRSRAPVSSSVIRRRLQRVLVPYLVVCAGVYVLRLVPWPASMVDIAFAIVTGNTYGIYYFVPVLVFCVLASYALSRLSSRMLWILLGGLVAYVVVITFRRSWMLTLNPFWNARDPFALFWLGYFVVGWLEVPPLLAAHVSRWALALIVLACLASIALVGLPLPLQIRIPYTVAVVALLWRAGWTIPGARFLSDASLAIYLLHYPIQLIVNRTVHAWPPIERIVVLWSTGLGGAIMLCLVLRAALGRERARQWIGA